MDQVAQHLPSKNTYLHICVYYVYVIEDPLQCLQVH
jgi:hypothetical protein